MSFLCEFERVYSRYILMLEQSLGRWDITCSQFRVLDILNSSQNDLRPKDLADILDIDVAASTRLIDRLEKKQMVDKVRCNDDRRVCFISLSDGFKEEFIKIKEHQDRVEDVFLSSLEKSKRKVFRETITELSKIRKYRSGEMGLSVVF